LTIYPSPFLNNIASPHCAMIAEAITETDLSIETLAKVKNG